MKIDFNVNNGELNVLLEGRLDTTTAPELESFLAENLNKASSVSFDLKALSYISSAGLRVLLATHKRIGGKFKLVNVNELVFEVLEMTGFADIWVIEK